MSLTKEDLRAIGGLLDERLEPIEFRLSAIESDMAEVKSDLAETKRDLAEVKVDLAETKRDLAEVKVDLAETKKDLSKVIVDLSETKETVTKNYNMFEEFFVHQREENTKIWNEFRIVHAQLDLHSKQLEFYNAKLSVM